MGEVHSNYFLEHTSYINVLKQWLILFACDLQQAKSSETSHLLGWNTTLALRNMTPIKKASLCFLLLLLYLFFSPWDFFSPNSITCLCQSKCSAETPLSQMTVFQQKLKQIGGVWDYVLKRLAAVTAG